MDNNDKSSSTVAADQVAGTTAVPADYSWAVTGSNWFLIAIGAALRDNWLMHGTLATFFGNVTAFLIAAAIPTCIIYLATTKKKSFRWRRAMTIAGWVLLAIACYPLLRHALETD